MDISRIEEQIKVENNSQNVTVVSKRFESGLFPEKSFFTVNEKYSLNPEYFPVCNSFVSDARSVLLYEPAGTGKSITAKLICREVGIPITAVINCTSNTDEFLLEKLCRDGGYKRAFCEPKNAFSA